MQQQIVKKKEVSKAHEHEAPKRAYLKDFYKGKTNSIPTNGSAMCRQRERKNQVLLEVVMLFIYDANDLTFPHDQMDLSYEVVIFQREEEQIHIKEENCNTINEISSIDVGPNFLLGHHDEQDQIIVDFLFCLAPIEDVNEEPVAWSKELIDTYVYIKEALQDVLALVSSNYFEPFYLFPSTHVIPLLLCFKRMRSVGMTYCTYHLFFT